MDKTVFFTRTCNLNPGLNVKLATCFKDVELSDDVHLERIHGGDPGGGNETLSREMEYPVGSVGFQHFINGHGIAQIRFDEGDAVNDTGYIFHAAPPSVCTDDFDLGVMLKDIFSEVTSGEPGNACDQNAHGIISSLERIQPLRDKGFLSIRMVYRVVPESRSEPGNGDDVVEW